MAKTGISHKEAVERQHKLEEWSGLITWTLYGLLAVLVVAVVMVLVEGQAKQKRLTELRSAWDDFFVTLRDARDAAGPDGLDNAAQIPVLEGLWEKTKGTPVQPFVAVELAQCHYQEAMDAVIDPATKRRVVVDDAIKRQRSELEKSLKVFDVVCQNWPDHPAYGPIAFQGAAMCQEQLKDYSAAIGYLEDGIKKHTKHFLVDRMRYDLARNYWLRSLKNEAEGNDGQEDRSLALEQVSRVVSEVADANANMFSWRYDARYLRSLLQEPGDGLKIFPEGKPPVRVQSRPVPKKAADTPKKADVKKAGEKPAEKKKAGEKKADEKKAGDDASEKPVEEKSDATGKAEKPAEKSKEQ